MGRPAQSIAGLLHRLLEQDRAKPPANELVEHAEGVRIGVLEIGEPAFEDRVQALDDPRVALPAGSSRPRPDLVLELVDALLADPTLSGFEPVAEELKPLPGLPAVAEMGL